MNTVYLENPPNISCKSSEILEYVQSNFLGPSKVQTHGGARYFLTIIDDYSRKLWIFFSIFSIFLFFLLKTKDEVFEKFVE